MREVEKLLNEAYNALVDEDDIDVDTALACIAHAKALIEGDKSSFDNQGESK
jgi:uncharacterized Fe-S cluster protein YjdI